MAAVRAGEASSSSTRRCSYEVFLSFRGKDTRKNFTDHLYTALMQAGIRTFRDDDEIERGEDIKSELRKAIRESKFSIIVFSKNYASSKWCLDELVMILERTRTSQHVVLPVFYHVPPSEVRNQSGGFAEAFARYAEANEWMEKVQGWRKALREVADLAGMELKDG
uniref:Putative TMV resistance protein N-like n=1 Tax=Davidia involucrata TaxID=16924 RepID=A0A5B6YS55_DAVIN